MNKHEQSDSTFPIVGVGASAGGLHALEEFFHAMTKPPGMAFVIVMHLSPDHKSLLAEILTRHTSLKVEAAGDGEAIKKDNVYVMPPNAVLTISEGRLCLDVTDARRHSRNPIDIFFSSLAQDRGEYAVGIVLSGSGTDGVLGVKAIKEHGGVTLAQTSDAKTSAPRFSGMPDSAIVTGLIDFAIPVEEMPARLLDVFQGVAKPVADADRTELADACKKIYAILRDQTGHDVSGYRIRTFVRRVYRRMRINRCPNLDDYVERLRRDPDEGARLFQELLVNVTSFFRDKDAFDALEHTIIPRLFEGKSASDWVRVWAPGCSTGEEVISIAMLLREHMENLPEGPRVTIFATDVDKPALEVARAGRYPEALLAGVSTERRQRFFIEEFGAYVVTRELRELCVFSSHDILRDPPFSHVDLIACRNVLMYFDAQAQQQVFPVFHYALKPNAFLFLGMTELVGKVTDLFAPVDSRHGLFQARETDGPRRMPVGWRPPVYAADSSGFDGSISGRRRRQLIEAHVADRLSEPHVIVNEEGDILHFSSKTGKYLESFSGAPMHQLLTTARKALRFDLRSAMREAIETHQTVKRKNVRLESEDDSVVTLTVEPLPETIGDRSLLRVAFVDERPALGVPKTEGEERKTPNIAEQLEYELREARDRLQMTIEEYETALEELKFANEELVSLNEEMLSNNDDLASSKEELQSTNDELHAVNQELYGKVDELDRANGDLRNVFSSAQIAAIFLDRDLVIRSFTPSALQLFNIIPTDAGRPLADLAKSLDYPNFLEDLQKVLETGNPIETRMQQKAIKGGVFLARLGACRGSAQQIEGVIAAFIDVTSLARLEGDHLLHTERSNAVGEMATGLAHEINQPLSATATYLKVIRRLLKMPLEERPASIEDALDRATDQIMRAGRIVSHLRTFVGNGKPKKTRESLHAILADVHATTVASASAKGVEIGLELTAEKDSVLVDKLRLKQVMLDLIRNSLEAINSLKPIKKHKITVKTSLNENDRVQIDVVDTSSNAPDLDAANLYHPFLTTTEKHLGAGLSISRLIVETHYEKVWTASNDEGGVTFSFTLPLADAS